jgi:hypothetical protein
MIWIFGAERSTLSICTTLRCRLPPTVNRQPSKQLLPMEVKPQGASQQKKNRDNEVASNQPINDESSIIKAATDRWAIEPSETKGLNGHGT